MRDAQVQLILMRVRGGFLRVLGGPRRADRYTSPYRHLFRPLSDDAWQNHSTGGTGMDIFTERYLRDFSERLNVRH